MKKMNRPSVAKQKTQEMNFQMNQRPQNPETKDPETGEFHQRANLPGAAVDLLSVMGNLDDDLLAEADAVRNRALARMETGVSPGSDDKNKSVPSSTVSKCRNAADITSRWAAEKTSSDQSGMARILPIVRKNAPAILTLAAAVVLFVVAGRLLTGRRPIAPESAVENASSQAEASQIEAPQAESAQEENEQQNSTQAEDAAPEVAQAGRSAKSDDDVASAASMALTQYDTLANAEDAAGFESAVAGQIHTDASASYSAAEGLIEFDYDDGTVLTETAASDISGNAAEDTADSTADETSVTGYDYSSAFRTDTGVYLLSGSDSAHIFVASWTADRHAFLLYFPETLPLEDAKSRISELTRK